ncbi:MAG: CRISPR-associated helicase/endonuclease Cas3 [Chitinispirillaceae bacterium]|nr:CRISPR-associated helicase/endonuclease Cas3 [Chitinispirillaceae bacterium]
MNSVTLPAYYNYWGKARRGASPPSPLSTCGEGEYNTDGNRWEYHLLVYHCLDVAAVGRVWLENDRALLQRISSALNCSSKEDVLNTIGLFFALHDFGKFDIRFQSKIPEIRNIIWKNLNESDLLLCENDLSGYDHGISGYSLFIKYFKELFAFENIEDEIEALKPWIAAVAGHHGSIPKQTHWVEPLAENTVFTHDRLSRKQWMKDILAFFHSDIQTVKPLTTETQPFIAGFCSVCDWIASSEDFVLLEKEPVDLNTYFKRAKEHCTRSEILEKFGVVGPRVLKYQGISTLLPDNSVPQQIQTLIENIQATPGITIIEGSTGSGKTEAALAIAWKLLDAGHVDSIVFALPTQATANAMLDRIKKLASKLFCGQGVNLVLAHGKAKYNETFEKLKKAGRTSNFKDQGIAQCAEWITKSKKLVFLGQIGVCTIDQVLLGVVPVRHNFMRTFGTVKSVLIVDEVHAYDRYMYGLLEAVLSRQKAANGSAILLSATLPAKQKQELFNSWNGSDYSNGANSNLYPLLSNIPNTGKPLFLSLPEGINTRGKTVKIEQVKNNDSLPDDSLYERITDAINDGAAVGVVCNVVDVAQSITNILRGKCSHPVDLFHSRYRFKDRQQKEKNAIDLYGKTAVRADGRVLVATQVIEQSLDLDFDWMITQLCPIDLLFQRLGRLHRHNRERPENFSTPFCTVLSTEKNDFGAHELIYGDTRVLWRSREMVGTCGGEIQFPGAYRKWIEIVYGAEEWLGENCEPESVVGKSCAFRQMQRQAWFEAQQIVTDGRTPWEDTDAAAISLTRGKEMGLNVVPVIADKVTVTLLDGECRNNFNEYDWAELLDMNSIPVPVSWKDWLPRMEDGYIFISMDYLENRWIWKKGNRTLTYDTDYGLKKMEDKE